MTWYLVLGFGVFIFVLFGLEDVMKDVEDIVNDHRKKTSKESEDSWRY